MIEPRKMLLPRCLDATSAWQQKFTNMLEAYGVTLGCITQYKLGPFRLQEEMQLAHRLGCQLIVTGGHGPRGLQGAELKKAVGTFVEQMKPDLTVAEETGVTIAIQTSLNRTPPSCIDFPNLLPSLARMQERREVVV